MKAYEVLEKYGWIQGAFGDEETGFCLMGAMWEAYSSIKARRVHCKRLRKAIGSEDLTGWNDKIGQEKQAVVKVLRKLAI